jgi:hypothetical protein
VGPAGEHHEQRIGGAGEVRRRGLGGAPGVGVPGPEDPQAGRLRAPLRRELGGGVHQEAPPPGLEVDGPHVLPDPREVPVELPEQQAAGLAGRRLPRQTTELAGVGRREREPPRSDPAQSATFWPSS